LVSVPGRESTKSGTLLGSPHYMSPEQARNSKELDHRSDLWSLGVIAFRCLTGSLPFQGEEISEVLIDICPGTMVRASSITPDLGPEYDRFFERALARDPEQRFQSARDLAEAIALLAGVARPDLTRLSRMSIDNGMTFLEIAAPDASPANIGP